jgi:hypothetical protein
MVGGAAALLIPQATIPEDNERHDASNAAE